MLGVTVLSITFCIVILGVLMLSFAFLLNKTFFITMLSAVMLHVVMLSVMALFNLVKNPIFWLIPSCHTEESLSRVIGEQVKRSS